VLPQTWQHHFLRDVVRAYRRRRDHQQQHLRLVEGIDDLLAPEGRAVDAALVDPELDSRGAQAVNELENAVLVVACVTDEDVCRLGHVVGIPLAGRQNRRRAVVFCAPQG